MTTVPISKAIIKQVQVRNVRYNWITKYFPNQPSSAEGGEVATNEKAEIPKDRLESKDKFEIVIDTAKMNEEEVGAYC